MLLTVTSSARPAETTTPNNTATAANEAEGFIVFSFSSGLRPETWKGWQ